MLILQNGKPADLHTRLEKEQKCYAFLETLAVPYGRIDHAPADTMEICAEIDKALDAVICKNLFLSNRQETAFYLLLIPGEKPFKTKYLSHQLGVSRLSFGQEAFMEQYLDCTPGSASVLGLMNDPENNVQLVIDRDVLTHPFFGCHPCINTSSLRIALPDLTERILPALHHPPIYVDLPWETQT